MKKNCPSLISRGALLVFAVFGAHLLISCVIGTYRPGPSPAAGEATLREIEGKMQAAFRDAVSCEYLEVSPSGIRFMAQYEEDAGFVRKPRAKRFATGVFDDVTMVPSETLVFREQVAMFGEIESIEVKKGLFGVSSRDFKSGCPVPGGSASAVVAVQTKRGQVCIGFKSMDAAKDFADALALFKEGSHIR